MLKPYKDPIAWQQASLKDRLQALRRHYCTGPSGQDQTTLEIRSNTDAALKEAVTTIAALADELAELRKQRDEARSKLSGLEAWFRTVLATRLQYRGYATDAAHPHGDIVAEIPEWELRRHLYECGELTAIQPEERDEVLPHA